MKGTFGSGIWIGIIEIYEFYFSNNKTDFKLQANNL